MTETITEHLARVVPHGTKCYGCPKGDPHGLVGYDGDIFCHLMEETMLEGNKDCGINLTDEPDTKAALPGKQAGGRAAP